MKYSDVINFEPIESVVKLVDANEAAEAARLVKSYVMSAGMAEQLQRNMLPQLILEDAVDTKGILLVGNYGTGKSHLMSVISSIAADESNLAHLQNRGFAKEAACIAGRYEVLRIEIGAVTTPLREIVLSKMQEDFRARGLTFDYPSADQITNNKETLLRMMQLFETKYPGKGYLIVVDEFLDFLRGKNEYAIRFDLGFMRELGEIGVQSRLRVIFGVQEKLFDNPAFSFISESINRVRDRFEQVVIRKEDTAYVVAERLLKKTDVQKAEIRERLQRFSSLYTNMSERMDEFVSLYPIHPAFIDVFNRIYIIENRAILANISKIIGDILDNDIPENAPGIYSFDHYWPFIRDNFTYRTDANIKEVTEKSAQLESILERSFPKKQYKPLALSIIYALSVHRLTTGDIQIRTGLTSENLRDDLCLFIHGLPDQSSDTLQSLVQTVLKDIMTTVSGQFIDMDKDNGQYYLDLKKDIDYDERIAQRADTLADDSLNRYFFEIVYECLSWDEKAYVPGFRIYQHTLNWDSHRFYRRGYLFLGNPEDRSTAQPAEDYYVYFLPPYGNQGFPDDRQDDEVFFRFKPDEDFRKKLSLYVAACIQRDQAEEKSKGAYRSKADAYKRQLTHYLNDKKNTCFEVSCSGRKSQVIEVLKSRYKQDMTFKEAIELVASILLEPWFIKRYPNFPIFPTTITKDNEAVALSRAYSCFSGKKEQLGAGVLEAFGLLKGDGISIQGSRFAQHYANLLDSRSPGEVLNFGNIYDEVWDARYRDKEFGIEAQWLVIVFLGLVYTGHAELTLRDGSTTLSAAELDNIEINETNRVFMFKHISKPKELQLAELVQLFEMLGLPPGSISNEQKREAGIGALLTKTKAITEAAARAKSKLNNDFALWGEDLLVTAEIVKLKAAAERVSEMLGNFPAKFNTVAKLRNFTYTTKQIEQLGMDIQLVNVALAYDAFRSECLANVSYMQNIEAIEQMKTQVAEAKDAFRHIRDGIMQGVSGESAAREVNEKLARVKKAYIDLYFSEHKKRRLDRKRSLEKSELIKSVKLADLTRLAEIDIMPKAQLAAMTSDLSALKTCIDLTPEMLDASVICPRCGFRLDGGEPLVKGQLERIDKRIDELEGEWTRTLLSTITDPIVEPTREFLSKDQLKVIDAFIATQALPDQVDASFVNAIKAMLQSYETVPVDGMDLLKHLTALGPCDADTFQSAITKLVADLAKGKDKSKLRIIIR